MNDKVILISDFHNLYKSQGLTKEVIKAFQNFIYSYYRRKRREFPFRNKITPYRVLVSEIMLQQTQTNRVSVKFLEFMDKFPNFISLAQASSEEILSVWQGLGYNRRAIALKNIAETIVNEFNGELPKDLELLKSFPQIGHNTASSILCFAYNIPTYFIETNIRRVYIYFFFPSKNKVNDKEIMKILKPSIDHENPRDWYYALMDFGVMLKKSHPELNTRSAHYKKQSKFDGSVRQIRGKLLKILLKNPLSITQIVDKINYDEKSLIKILEELKDEGFIQKKQGTYYIAG